MKKWKEYLDTLTESVTITKLDVTLFFLVGTLAGIIVGMLISPRKNARYGCNNGTTEIHNWHEPLEEDEETV